MHAPTTIDICIMWEKADAAPCRAIVLGDILGRCMHAPLVSEANVRR